jgi:hypothetical protein
VQPSAPEPDDVAGDVADRPHQPPDEPVHQPALTRPREAADRQLVVGEAAAAQVPYERVPAARRVADAEALGRLLVEPALVEEGPCGKRVGRRELLGVELLGDPVRLEQPRRWPCCRPGVTPPSSYRSWMPARPASRSTASANPRCSILRTKSKTSPLSWQPKQ